MTARSSVVDDGVYGSPDLVVEVLSPHPRIGRLDERVGWFARYGVRECWLVDLRLREIAVLVLSKTGVQDRRLIAPTAPIRSDVLAGISLTPQQVFGY